VALLPKLTVPGPQSWPTAYTLPEESTAAELIRDSVACSISVRAHCVPVAGLGMLVVPAELLVPPDLVAPPVGLVVPAELLAPPELVAPPVGLVVPAELLAPPELVAPPVGLLVPPEPLVPPVALVVPAAAFVPVPPVPRLPVLPPWPASLRSARPVSSLPWQAATPKLNTNEMATDVLRVFMLELMS